MLYSCNAFATIVANVMSPYLFRPKLIGLMGPVPLGGIVRGTMEKGAIAILPSKGSTASAIQLLYDTLCNTLYIEIYVNSYIKYS